MAETHTTPSNLNKNENVPINSRIMVTSPAGETTTAAALAFLDVIATCTSAADAENKVVQIPDYTELVLPNNLKLHVTFTNGNTYGDTTSSVVYYPKLAIYNANSQLIGTLDICDSRGHFAGSGFCNAGDQMDFVRVGDKAKITNSDVRQVTQAYTILSDGQNVYNANQVNGALTQIGENLGNGIKINRLGNLRVININASTCDSVGNLIYLPTQDRPSEYVQTSGVMLYKEDNAIYPVYITVDPYNGAITSSFYQYGGQGIKASENFYQYANLVYSVD